MTEYLLDTSVFYLSQSKEEEISKLKGIFSLTASYLVPIELLSGTKLPSDPEALKENPRRKAALGRYYRLVGFDSTNWEDENVLTLKAFRIPLSSRDKSDIKQLIRDYKDASDFDEVERQYSQLLNEIRQLDREKVSDYLLALETIRQEVGKVLTLGGAVDEKTSMLLALAISSFFAYLKSWGMSESALSALLSVVGSMTRDDIWKLTETLRFRYDGSLDLFIKFWPEYLEQRRTFERADKKKRNDVFDWGHIFCLRAGDTGQIFVTGDNFLHDLVKIIAPDRVLSKEVFFKRIGVGE
jgi:hypothetical protein